MNYVRFTLTDTGDESEDLMSYENISTRKA